MYKGPIIEISCTHARRNYRSTAVFRGSDMPSLILQQVLVCFILEEITLSPESRFVELIGHLGVIIPYLRKDECN